MKAFCFRLQTKLEITQLQEKQAREELLAALSRRDQIALRLQQLDERLQELEAGVRNLGSTSCSSQQLIVYSHYFPVFRSWIKATQMEMLDMENQVEHCRSVLFERKRETQTLERLREREWQRYVYEMNLAEQKVIDELATSAHYRKKLPG